jgi:hypothetical protein
MGDGHAGDVPTAMGGGFGLGLPADIRADKGIPFNQTPGGK